MLGSTLAVLNGRKKFNLSELQKAITKAGGGAIYDPSTLWGAADHLPRRNLLTSTATLATQTKTVTAVFHTLYIKGTGSVTLSGVATGTLTGTGASDRVSLTFTPTAGSLVMTVTGSVTEGHLTTTATTDHSYQAITDWVSEQYAHAAAKNVPWLRRNFLNSTDDFTTSSWSKDNGSVSKSGATPIDGGTASLFTETAGTAIHRLSQLQAVPSGTYDISVYLKAGTRRYAYVEPYNGSPKPGVALDLQTGTVITLSDLTTASVYTVTDAGNGWWKITIPTAVSSSYTSGFYSGSCSGNNGTRQADGSGTFSYYAASMVLSGYPSNPYQPISSTWDAQYAANAAAAGVALTMYTDRAGTIPANSPDSVLGKLNDLSGGGYHRTAATDAKRPLLKLDANGYWYVLHDLIDDDLPATFPNFGANCVSYINDGSTVTETTGVTLNGALSMTTPARDYGRVYLASQSGKAASIIKWLKAKAGL
jgi:hypothetical protein